MKTNWPMSPAVTSRLPAMFDHLHHDDDDDRHRDNDDDDDDDDDNDHHRQHHHDNYDDMYDVAGPDTRFPAMYLIICMMMMMRLPITAFTC